MLNKEMILNQSGLDDLLIKEKRTNFVANKVVLSQFAFLLTTGILTTLLYSFRNIILHLWIVFLILIPGMIIVVYYHKRDIIFYKIHWIVIVFPFAILWLSITLFLGIFFDTTFGTGKTITVSLFLSIFYITGYILASILRKIHGKWSKRAIIFFCVLLILFTFLIGLRLIIQSFINANIRGIDFEEYGMFLSCESCILSIFIAISGLAIVISGLLNYWMLYAINQSKKKNVLTESPNRLIHKFLLATVIIMFLIWLLMILLLPPIVGGGDSDRSKKKSSNNS